MKNTKKSALTGEVMTDITGAEVVAKGTDEGTGKGTGFVDKIECENDYLLFLVFVARLAATDTYHTSERPETRFRRAYDEAVTAVEIFNKKKGGLK